MGPIACHKGNVAGGIHSEYAFGVEIDYINVPCAIDVDSRGRTQARLQGGEIVRPAAGDGLHRVLGPNCGGNQPNHENCNCCESNCEFVHGFASHDCAAKTVYPPTKLQRTPRRRSVLMCASRQHYTAYCSLN